MSSVFANCTIAVSGTHKDWTQAKLDKGISGNGGTFSKVVDDDTTHLITTDADYEKGSKKVKDAQQNGVHIVKLSWYLDSVEKQQRMPEATYAVGSGNISAAGDPSGNSIQSNKRAANQSDDEEPEPPTKKAKSGPAKGRGRKATATKNEEEDADEEEEKKPQMKTVIKKGKAPVDELCPLKDTHHVYVDPSGEPYDATLNQTNIGGNNNKFYYCQLLESDAGQKYAVFCHWGRVGDRGQSKTYIENTSLGQAESVFNKQFKSKTGKTWDDRANAVGGGGKYAYLSRNYEEDDDEGGDHDETSGAANKPAESKLHSSLQALIRLIFNSTYMEQSMKELSYDSNKLPLGKLSKDTISRGYQALKTLGEAISTPSQAVANFGQYGNTLDQICQELSNRYYTVIPHSFGRNVPPTIKTPQQLKKEIELIENLSEMVVTQKIMKDTKSSGEAHPLDMQYESLGLNEATPLDRDSTEFEHLQAYVQKTHGSTHHMKLQVEDIFRITRSVEEERWKSAGWDSLTNDNRKLLWHGSRTTNFAGILSQGLRIAPPEAPVNGYMFDKGIYLADLVTKSAGYCNAHASGNTGLLLLCEAQLGDPMFELKHADYHAATNCKNAGALATKGLGRTAPLRWEDASIVHDTLQGVEMPAVSGKESTIVGPSQVTDVSLQYNEYITYDISQVKIRYLFRCRWG